MFFSFPEDARWNVERNAVEFGVEIGEYEAWCAFPAVFSNAFFWKAPRQNAALRATISIEPDSGRDLRHTSTSADSNTCIPRDTSDDVSVRAVHTTGLGSVEGWASQAFAVTCRQSMVSANTCQGGAYAEDRDAQHNHPEHRI